MSESEKRLKISNQTFSNEIDLDKYVEWDALSRIDFINCRFKRIDFLGKIINFCNFKNSEFNDLSFRKCQFGNIDLTRAELGYCKFLNCRFIDCDLSASDFCKCVFFETSFNNTNLKFSIAKDIKFWKSTKFYKSNSNEFIEVKNQSNFEKILKDMNLIISIDQDEIENC